MYAEVTLPLRLECNTANILYGNLGLIFHEGVDFLIFVNSYAIWAHSMNEIIVHVPVLSFRGGGVHGCVEEV